MALEINGAVLFESYSLGLEHRALEPRVLVVGRDAALRVDDALPRDRSLFCRADRPAHADRREPPIDEARDLAVRGHLAARDAPNHRPDLLKRRDLFAAFCPPRPLWRA